MTTEQRRALADTTPTTEVIRDAVTFPRDRLGEPLDIDGARFDAWLAQVKRDAAREALVEYAKALNRNRSASVWSWSDFVYDVFGWVDGNYPEDVTP